ncbi:PREDICTED: uncharacterized protein LOC104588664 isoform X2 [Nelumbo nucifera]|uniref:Uncharacterized protein LOC104588664 isoform X2 n=1 Tax=Nelumbo nucifera TaxID=4432 RepID=A0A1U7Z2V3_NELNU|nr:PREDICTED: uncharacterized protein LOC104588664 isoform X2 [Nelumbo nucifera]
MITRSTIDGKHDIGAETVFLANESKLKRDLSRVQYYECKEFGHVVSHCKKKNTCTYYKQQGHIITECPTRPLKGHASTPKKNLHKAYRSTLEGPDDAFVSFQTSAKGESSSALTEEKMRQLVSTTISSAFSAIGLSGPAH